MLYVCAHCTERRIAYFVLAYIYSFSSFLFFSYGIYYDTKYIYIYIYFIEHVLIIKLLLRITRVNDFYIEIIPLRSLRTFLTFV